MPGGAERTGATVKQIAVKAKRHRHIVRVAGATWTISQNPTTTGLITAPAAVVNITCFQRMSACWDGWEIMIHPASLLTVFGRR